MSFSENNLRSSTLYLRFAIRSIPIPNAYPVYCLESMPLASSTAGSTMPHPKISTQPVCLQKAQPLPPQMSQLISISAEGSVNGKYDGRNLIFVSVPNISRANNKRTCFKSVNDTFLSTYNPSTWWKKQWARAEMASFRYTRPGQITLIGGCVFSITRL